MRNDGGFGPRFLVPKNALLFRTFSALRDVFRTFPHYFFRDFAEKTKSQSLENPYFIGFFEVFGFFVENLAENKGFEPLQALRLLLVFETSPFNRLGNSPLLIINENSCCANGELMRPAQSRGRVSFFCGKIGSSLEGFEDDFYY